MVKVKICGITNIEDAQEAVKCGADALGFIFYEKSPRYITPEKAASIIKELPPLMLDKFGVFVDEPIENIKNTKRITGINVIQLHGNEGAKECAELKDETIVKAFRIEKGNIGEKFGLMLETSGCNNPTLLLDAYSETMYGGTGKTFDWDFAVEAREKYGNIILAGGLTPDNVANAVKKVRPYAVDVSSGVEERPGKKDMKKIKAFIERAKEVYSVQNYCPGLPDGKKRA